MWRLFAAIYTAYAALVILLLWLWHVPLVAILPKRQQRRWLARINMRLALRFIGLPIRVKGFEQLPATPCIVVANHGSYLDGPLMNALLPDRFRIVIKNEAEAIPLVGWYLKRIGSIFVERHNFAAAAKDSNHIQSLAANGASIVMFPEGGFSSDKGLKRFKTGAFSASAKTGLPIYPIAISGTREALHPNRLTMRPRCLTVTCLPAIMAQDDSRAEIRRISQVAHDRIELTLGSR